MYSLLCDARQTKRKSYKCYTTRGKHLYPSLIFRIFRMGGLVCDVKIFEYPKNFSACGGLKKNVICRWFSCSFSVEISDLKFLIRKNFCAQTQVISLRRSFPPEFTTLFYLQKLMRPGASYFIIRTFLAWIYFILLPTEISAQMDMILKCKNSCSTISSRNF